MGELTEEQIKDLYEKAKLIELKPVISSNIGGIGYDTENKLLKVAFKTKTGSSIYLYEGVEQEVYESLYQSESVGKKLSESIIKQKDKYRYIKL